MEPAPKLKDPPSATRRSKRNEGSGVALLVANREDRGAWRKARILDLSTHGARVQTETPLFLGEEFEFIPPEGEEYAVPCRVVWAGEVGSESEGQSGLEFLTPYSPHPTE